VLVRVHAAGRGPDVWHLMTGLPYCARLMVGFRKPRSASEAGTSRAYRGGWFGSHRVPARQRIETPEAPRYLERGHPRGKAVITI
jgi:hypothetical protein